MFKHILLPLDGSKLAEAAIPYTVELCTKLQSELTLIHIIEKGASAEIHGERHLTNEQEACDYLGEIAENKFGFMKKVNRHVHSEEVDQVAKSIVSHSDEFSPDLIILCAHGEGGIRDIVAGSIAQQVISAGTVPVLLIKPEHEQHKIFSGFAELMVPLDGEPEHEKSLETAGNLARSLGAGLRLIRVVPTLSTLTGELSKVSTLLPSTTNAYLEISENEACEYLQKKLNYWRKQGVACQAEVQRGDIAQEVVQSAISSNSSMIVLGTHGKAGLNAFWAASVAPKIVAKAGMPILLLPVRRK